MHVRDHLSESNLEVSRDSSNNTDNASSVTMAAPEPELDDETKVRIAIVAKDIFSRYLARDADNFIILDAELRAKVFEKFGYTEPDP